MTQNLKFDRKFYRDLWQLLTPYWSSEEKWSAYGLLAAIIALIVAQVCLNIAFMDFYRDFFDALQNYNKPFLIHSIWKFSGLALALILAVGYNIYLGGLLSIRWRRWLTKHYLKSWLENHTYYRMQVLNKNVDNPDQRISEDLDVFPSTAVSLFTSLLTSILTLFYFGIVLWQLSGNLTLPLGTLGTWVIPGYLLWAAIIYAAIGTPLTFFIGRIFSKLNYLQQRFNADFRFGMMRLREASEQIALYRGEHVEHSKFSGQFAQIFDNTIRMIKIQKNLMFFSFGYNTISYMFSLAIGLPLYFAKKIQIGGIIQINTAFGQVIGALSVLISAFTTIANWRSVIHRLAEFNNSMAEVKTLSYSNQIKLAERTNEHLLIDQLSLSLPNGDVLLNNFQLNIQAGDKILINGISGSGKSTLLRTLAGIWPFGSGSIRLPLNSIVMFLPQKPYLPLGSLREAMLYPNHNKDISTDELKQILSLCGLEKLQNELDTVRNWAHELSLGEQQLIGFARVLIQKPNWIFLDEATSALDETSEAQMYNKIHAALPTATIVSVGHRHTLRDFHNKEIEIVRFAV